MKNSQFNSHDIKMKCEHKLGMNFDGKKELNARMRYKGKFIRVTVPKGRKRLPPKTYKTIANQLYLSTSQFDNLLSCPFSKDDFFNNLESK